MLILKDYYKPFHLDLAKKHNTTYSIVRTLRERHLHAQLSQVEIKQWVAEKLLYYQTKHTDPKPKYLELLDFLNLCTPEQFEDITQATTLDYLKKYYLGSE